MLSSSLAAVAGRARAQVAGLLVLAPAFAFATLFELACAQRATKARRGRRSGWLRELSSASERRRREFATSASASAASRAAKLVSAGSLAQLRKQSLAAAVRRARAREAAGPLCPYFVIASSSSNRKATREKFGPPLDGFGEGELNARARSLACSLAPANWRRAGRGNELAGERDANQEATAAAVAAER